MTTTRVRKKLQPTAGDIHLSPDGIYRRCIARADCPFYGPVQYVNGVKQDHVSLVGIASGGGGTVNLHGHAKGLTVTPVIDGVFGIGGEQRKRYFFTDGTQLDVNAVKRWKRKQARATAESEATTPAAEEAVIDAPADELVVTPIEELSYKKEFGEAAPTFVAAAKMTEAEWLALPWKNRKYMIENIYGEVKRYFDDRIPGAKESDVQWGGWSNAKGKLGFTTFWRVGSFPDYHVKKEIKLSVAGLQHRNQLEGINTIIHELAHSYLPHTEGHGDGFHAKFRELLDVTIPKQETDNEAAAFTAAEKEAKLFALKNTRYISVCPKGHIYYEKGKPRKQYGCGKTDCRDLPFAERLLTTQKNPDYVA